MAAYADSEDMPFVLAAQDLEPLTLREAVRGWMQEGKILSSSYDDDAGDIDALTGLLVNFGAVRWVSVGSTPPATSKPVIRWDNTDLQNL